MPWVEVQNHVKIVTWICYLPISSFISSDQGRGHVGGAIEDSLVSFQISVDSEVCGADEDWRNHKLDDDTGDAVCKLGYFNWKILKNEKLSWLCMQQPYIYRENCKNTSTQYEASLKKTFIFVKKKSGDDRRQLQRRQMLDRTMPWSSETINDRLESWWIYRVAIN